MIKTLDQKLSVKSVMWLFPLFFLLHDTEEIFTIEDWMKANKDDIVSVLPEKFHTLVESVNLTVAQTAVAVSVLLLILLSCTYLGVQARKPGWRMLIFTGALTMLFGNVFTHLAQTLMFGGYTPGVITAVLISLPYGLYAYHRLFQAKLINRRYLMFSFFITMAMLPLVPFAHWVGRMIA